MKRLILVVVLVLLSACVRGEDVVAACEDAVAARNALPCAGAAVNPTDECGVLNDGTDAQLANPAAPNAVRQCALSDTCGNAELLEYYSCRTDSTACDENDAPTYDPACDDTTAG